MRILPVIFFLSLTTGCAKSIDLVPDTESSIIEETKIDEDYRMTICAYPRARINHERWMAYLKKKLQPDSALLEAIPAGTYKSIIQFEMKKDGTIINASIIKNPGYGLGEKALQVVREYKEEPEEDGFFEFLSYHRQPITFVIEE